MKPSAIISLTLTLSVFFGCSDTKKLEETFENEFGKSVKMARHNYGKSFNLIQQAYYNRMRKVEPYYKKAETANIEAEVFFARVDTFLAHDFSETEFKSLITAYHETDSIIRGSVPQPQHPRFTLDTLTIEPLKFDKSSPRLTALMLSNHIAITTNRVIEYLFYSIDIEHDMFSDHVDATAYIDNKGNFTIRLQSKPMLSFPNRVTVIDSVFVNGTYLADKFPVTESSTFAEVDFGKRKSGTYQLIGHTTLIREDGATYDERFSEEIEIKY